MTRNRSILLALRISKGESQADTATALKVAITTYSRWERGILSPSAGALLDLALHFGVDPHDLRPLTRTTRVPETKVAVEV